MTEPVPQTSPDWRQAIQAAKREDDPEKLASLLQAAEDAIFLRFQELNGKSTKEREAMDRAVATLRKLQVKKLNFPSWESENEGEQAQFLPRRHFLWTNKIQSDGDNSRNKPRKSKTPRS
jgi:hypothetical protein